MSLASSRLTRSPFPAPLAPVPSSPHPAPRMTLEPRPPLALQDALVPDLLHPEPMTRIDVGHTRLAIALAFASGVSGGLFAEALDQAKVAPSTWEPASFTSDLFLPTFVSLCFKIRIGDQELHARVVDDVRELAHLVAAVHGHRHDPEPQRREQRDEVLDRVTEHEPDVVSRPDPGAEQAARERHRALGKLVVADPLFGHDDRVAMRERDRPIDERRDCLYPHAGEDRCASPKIEALEPGSAFAFGGTRFGGYELRPLRAPASPSRR